MSYCSVLPLLHIWRRLRRRLSSTLISDCARKHFQTGNGESDVLDIEVAVICRILLHVWVEPGNEKVVDGRLLVIKSFRQ